MNMEKVCTENEVKNKLADLILQGQGEGAYYTSPQAAANIANWLIDGGALLPPVKLGDKLFCVLSAQPVGSNRLDYWVEPCVVNSLSFHNGGINLVRVIELRDERSGHIVKYGVDAFDDYESAERAMYAAAGRDLGK